jgi:hypothetical protein
MRYFLFRSLKSGGERVRRGKLGLNCRPWLRPPRKKGCKKTTADEYSYALAA